jgi:hypothetical protein
VHNEKKPPELRWNHFDDLLLSLRQRLSIWDEAIAQVDPRALVKRTKDRRTAYGKLMRAPNVRPKIDQWLGDFRVPGDYPFLMIEILENSFLGLRNGFLDPQFFKNRKAISQSWYSNANVSTFYDVPPNVAIFVFERLYRYLHCEKLLLNALNQEETFERARGTIEQQLFESYRSTRPHESEEALQKTARNDVEKALKVLKRLERNI